MDFGLVCRGSQLCVKVCRMVDLSRFVHLVGSETKQPGFNLR
jgi:hypothetical protein